MIARSFFDLDEYLIHVSQTNVGGYKMLPVWFHYALTRTSFTPAMVGVVLTQYRHHGNPSRMFQDPADTLRFWVYELLFKELMNRLTHGDLNSTAKPLENLSIPESFQQLNPLAVEGGDWRSKAVFTDTPKARLERKVKGIIDRRNEPKAAYCVCAYELTPGEAVEIYANGYINPDLHDGSPVEVGQPAMDMMKIIDPVIVDLVEGSDAKLPLVLDPEFVADLHDAPHVLVAGATGSGKSVALHAMIQGVLVAGADVWIVDPKTVEAAPYQGLAKVFFRDDAVDAFAQILEMMDERYDLMMDQRVREWEGQKTVLVVDEYSDLMLGSGKSAARAMEDQIVRIAQMGRAAGIHLILATQRPSADVITGRIKANMPVRLTMKCSSPVDSRIIRGDNRGYDELATGNGHGLYNDRRVRAPFVDPYPAYNAAR